MSNAFARKGIRERSSDQADQIRKGFRLGLVFIACCSGWVLCSFLVGLTNASNSGTNFDILYIAASDNCRGGSFSSGTGSVGTGLRFGSFADAAAVDMLKREERTASRSGPSFVLLSNLMGGIEMRRPLTCPGPLLGCG
jgi:hypothetical protein